MTITQCEIDVLETAWERHLSGFVGTVKLINQQRPLFYQIGDGGYKPDLWTVADEHLSSLGYHYPSHFRGDNPDALCCFMS